MTDYNTEEQMKDILSRLSYAESEIERLSNNVGKVEYKTDRLEQISAELKSMIESHKKEINELKQSIEKVLRTVNEIADINKYEMLKIETEVKLIHKDLASLAEIPKTLNDHMLEMQNAKEIAKTIKRIGMIMVTALITLAINQLWGL